LDCDADFSRNGESPILDSHPVWSSGLNHRGNIGDIFLQFPMTFRTSAWYASIGFGGLFLALAFTAYGLWTSTGNRPLLLDRMGTD
jgi:hypothetical protein